MSLSFCTSTTKSPSQHGFEHFALLESPSFFLILIKKISLILLFVLTIPFASNAQTGIGSAPPHTIHVVRFSGSINPASADYLHQALTDASANHAQCLILQLNTPGGLLSSTRKMVGDILDSDIPVVVYVSPAGAQAASAGVFITMAANYAAMTPGSNIGAAHPVLMSGQMDSVMSAKSANDAAAFIRSIAERRHRNAAWAEEAVRKSVALSENEALREHVIDTVATDLNALILILDGRRFETARGPVVIATRDAQIISVELSVRQKLLDLLSDPNITYILLMLGIWGIIFELYNPGLILPGIVGVISLLLSGYAMNMLPVNYAGLALILFAIILLILEIKITSHGMLALGGITSLLIGSFMLFRGMPDGDSHGVAISVLLCTVGLTAAFFIFVIGAGLKAQHKKPTTGVQGLIGESGVAVTALNPDGTVRVHGEFWKATATGATIPEGAAITVLAVENLRMSVMESPHTGQV